MRKTGLLIFFVILVSGELMSQPSTFLKSYSNGNSGYAVRELNGNSYVVAGATDFYYNFHWFTQSSIATTNVHLFKSMDDGTLLWEKIINQPGARTLATWMETTQDGGFIITGHSNKETIWPPDSNDVLLIKCDLNGTIQWSKIIDSGKDELGYCVRQTFDGGYIISGFHDEVPTSLVGNTYALLIKTDANGNVQWDKMYELAVRDLDTGESLPWVVSQTADSGFVLAGTTVGAHQADLYVIRTGSAGNVLWAKSYEHDNSVNRFSLGLDIIEDAAGDLVIAGSMDKDHNAMEYNYPYILKLDASGSLIRAAIYTSIPAESFQSGFSSVEECPDGGFLFTGMGGYGGFGNQAQILKTDVNFNMQWSRSYTLDGIATMGSRSGRSTSDGCYIFTGKRQMAGSVLLKTDFIGLVPCKSPAVLVEIVPGILVQNRFPASISGINASNVVLNSMVTGIDTSTLCPVTFSHLPVELISFSARSLENNTILLEWETASEINNDYFMVEKSTDGTLFSEVGKVKGGGNSTQPIYYSLIDTEVPEVKLLYYRLLQIDFDGLKHYSEIVPVYTGQKDFKMLKILSDPSVHMIKFYLQSREDGPLTCVIRDALGKTNYQKVQHTGKGINLIEVDVKNLSPGFYYYSFSNAVECINGKIHY